MAEARSVFGSVSVRFGSVFGFWVLYCPPGQAITVIALRRERERERAYDLLPDLLVCMFVLVLFSRFLSCFFPFLRTFCRLKFEYALRSCLGLLVGVGVGVVVGVGVGAKD